MKKWLSVRDSELYKFVESEPPPVSGEHIDNSLVWIVAIIPIVVALIDASLASQPGAAIGRAIAPRMGIEYAEKEVPWFIPFIMNSIFCLWDERRLHKAGHSSHWMTSMAIILVPAYLFLRAKKLKQRPTYAITWIILIVLSVFLVDAARSF